tara:strand:+ start:61 stop:474 length:414 start_codon:yes stop_codon:yes gene_type:complete
MNKEVSLEILPLNFRHEKEFLLKSEFNNWSRLSKLRDADINNILRRNPLCTESRLKKIRAISIFICELKITPSQAYLLLHCGIGSIKALSTIDAHIIEKRIGRLERSLNIKKYETPSIIVLKNWIKKAKLLELDNLL